MEEKRYLKWYNKLGYGSGDIAGNMASPLMAAVLITILLYFQKVEKVNRELAAAKDKRSVTIECKRGGQYAKKAEFSME